MRFPWTIRTYNYASHEMDSIQAIPLNYVHCPLSVLSIKDSLEKDLKVNQIRTSFIIILATTSWSLLAHPVTMNQGLIFVPITQPTYSSGMLL